MSDERKKYNPVDFEKACDIRKGKRDDELPGYEIITGWIQRVPITWLPGLLNAVVSACAIRGVFKSNSHLLDYVENCADKATDPASILRGAERDE